MQRSTYPNTVVKTSNNILWRFLSYITYPFRCCLRTKSAAVSSIENQTQYNLPRLQDNVSHPVDERRIAINREDDQKSLFALIHDHPATVQDNAIDSKKNIEQAKSRIKIVNRIHYKHYKQYDRAGEQNRQYSSIENNSSVALYNGKCIITTQR